MEDFNNATEQLEEYLESQPDHFDRKQTNQRLKQFAQGDDQWRWEPI
jgi:hypothetical protein